MTAWFAAGAVLSACLMLGMRRVETVVRLLRWQALCLVGVVAATWLAEQESLLGVALAVALVGKAGLIPAALLRLIRGLAPQPDGGPLLAPRLSLVAGAGAILLAAAFADRFPGGLPLPSARLLAAAITLALLGLFLVSASHKALIQIVGLFVIENGIYLAGMAVARGLPLLVELGVVFDLCVAVLVATVLLRRMNLTLQSLRTDRLRQLRG